MAINTYSNNLNSGTNQKGNLGDFQHAARLFLSNNYKFAPKNKFLYHVYFSINKDVESIASSLIQKYSTEIGMLVKSTELPKYDAQIETRNKYNRKKHVQVKINYQPITLQLHDDNHGVTTAILEAYYRWYYADAWHGNDPGAYSKVSQDNTYLGSARNQFRYGLDNALSVPFFNNIQISQLSRNQYTTYTLVNPIIRSWGHDSVESQDRSTPMANQMTIEYEAVHYSRGTINENAPSGFGSQLYDQVPSPLDVQRTASAQPTTDLNILRPNSITNNPNQRASTTLSSDSFPGNSLNRAFTIGGDSSNTSLSGLQNLAIPKSAVPATTSLTTIRPSSASITSKTLFRSELEGNPALLEEQAKLIHRNDFLLAGGSGINEANIAWNNLPNSSKDNYKTQVLDKAI